MATFVAVILGCALVAVVRIAAGKLASIGTTAVCGAFMAYFLMPPVLSFQVSRSADLATLAGYGGFGLVLTRVGRRKTTQHVTWQNPSRNGWPPAQQTSVALVVESLLASDFGTRLAAADIIVDVEDAVMPWARGDMIRILSAVITDAIGTPGTKRISIYGGRRPGIRRLVVAVHRIWPHPLNVVITIGKADRDCQHLQFLALPRNSRASWFDNGYDYVYQFSAEESSERGISACDNARLPEAPTRDQNTLG